MLLFQRRTAQEGRSRDGCDSREISSVRNIVQKPCFLCFERSRQTLWSVRRSTIRSSILAVHLTSSNLHEQMLCASMWQNMLVLLSLCECGTYVDTMPTISIHHRHDRHTFRPYDPRHPSHLCCEYTYMVLMGIAISLYSHVYTYIAISISPRVWPYLCIAMHTNI